jgi:hypothetical protein
VAIAMAVVAATLAAGTSAAALLRSSVGTKTISEGTLVVSHASILLVRRSTGAKVAGA